MPIERKKEQLRRIFIYTQNQIQASKPNRNINTPEKGPRQASEESKDHFVCELPASKENGAMD